MKEFFKRMFLFSADAGEKSLTLPFNFEMDYLISRENFISTHNISFVSI